MLLSRMRELNPILLGAAGKWYTSGLIFSFLMKSYEVVVSLFCGGPIEVYLKELKGCALKGALFCRAALRSFSEIPMTGESTFCWWYAIELEVGACSVHLFLDAFLGSPEPPM